MKTKSIKKINLGLLAVLLSMTAAAGSFLLFKQNFDVNHFAGKASEMVLQQNENLRMGSKQEVVLKGDPESEAVAGTVTDKKENAEDRQNSLEQTPKRDDYNEKQKFTFAAVGDSDSKKTDSGFSSKFEHALKQIKGYSPDLVLFTGDILRMGNAEGQSKKKLENLKSIIESHYNNYYFAFGYHDIECGLQCINSWGEVFFGKKIDSDLKEEQKLYHSFDYQNTHFVLLSTDHPKRYSIDEKQFQWLENDLMKNKMPNKIIVQHTPPIAFFENASKQCHDMTCDEKMRQKLIALYKQYGVDLVVSGNENAFDHQIVEGIDFVLSGSIDNESEHKGVIKGDIYILCKIEGEKIFLEALTTQGEIVRKIEVK